MSIGVKFDYLLRYLDSSSWHPHKKFDIQSFGNGLLDIDDHQLTIQSSPIDITNSKHMHDFPSMHL